MEGISQFEMDRLSRTLITAMEEFYSDPENLKRFEEWKQSKEGQDFLKSVGL